MVAHRIRQQLQSASSGFLLPVVIALGLGIGTVSVLALQSIAQNSTTLNNQNYSAIAREAAQAGIAAAKSCVLDKKLDNTKTPLSTWTDASPLTPQKDCDNNTVSGRAADVTNNAAFSSTYEVKGVTRYPNSDNGIVITSVGIVKVKAPSGSGTVRTITQTVRTTAIAQAPSSVTVGKAVGQVSTGATNACAVTTIEGWVYCWGDNATGELGIGRTSLDALERSPKAVASNTAPLPANPGVAHTQTVCELIIICHTETTYNPEPTPAQPASALMNANGSRKFVTKVSVGANHACVIAKDSAAASDSTRKVYCWGSNSGGQLGNRTTTTSFVPVAVDLQAEWTTPGYCAASLPIVGCVNYIDPVVNPASALRNKTVVDISVGDDFSCALASDATTACWGANADGQLGKNDTSASTVPREIYRREAYTIPGYCSLQVPIFGCLNWVDAVNVPATALWNKTVKTLARVQNGKTMCVTDTADRAYCWGNNDRGQVGDGKTYQESVTRSATGECAGGATTYPPYPGPGAAPDFMPAVTEPTAVATTITFSSIVTSSSGTVAKTTASAANPNRLYYWLSNINSELTDTSRSRSACGSTGGSSGSGVNKWEGTSESTYRWSNTPVLREKYSSGPLDTAIGLHSGAFPGDRLCAVLATGSPLYCNEASVNVANLSGAGIEDISSGSNFQCLVAQNNVYCWGSNNRGQLGTNDSTSRTAPTLVFSDPGGDGLGTSSIVDDHPETFDQPITF